MGVANVLTDNSSVRVVVMVNDGDGVCSKVDEDAAANVCVCDCPSNCGCVSEWEGGEEGDSS